MVVYPCYFLQSCISGMTAFQGKVSDFFQVVCVVHKYFSLFRNILAYSVDSPHFIQSLIKLQVDRGVCTLCCISAGESFALQTVWPMFNNMPSAQ